MNLRESEITALSMMMSATGWNYLFLFLLFTGFASLAKDTGDSCLKPVISPNSEVVPFGASVNLTCPGCSGLVSWSYLSPSERNFTRTVSGEFVLKYIQYSNEGNYTCFKDGQEVCTVELLVAGELEQPEFHCYLRHPASTIICEWRHQKMLPPATKTFLMVKKKISSSPTLIPCSHNTSAQRFRCHLKIPEGDSDKHMVTMCVTSRTDRRGSNTLLMDTSSILQPDAPVNVTVMSVKEAPTKLSVTWQYPPSWDSIFYQLHFEIEYWVENSKKKSNFCCTKETDFMIVDALKGRKYYVIVRAQEEFNRGSWGNWSTVAQGEPWTDPDSITLKTDALPTQDFREYYPEYISTEYISTAFVYVDDPAVPRYTFLVAAASLALVIFLLIGIVIRQTVWRKHVTESGKKWKILFLLKKGGESHPLSSESIPMASSQILQIPSVLAVKSES
ncbi:interleukin-6 receptor subunit alpha [Bombina bombina]|uniref:interleukin-6 receptor subunit alpha n=1 Tax=Bombina bombina TaxID=8345 RepID=UPI00235A5B4B|nr:interleukin-6 receptor subunit alpha [Bombina bombina]